MSTDVPSTTAAISRSSSSTRTRSQPTAAGTARFRAGCSCGRMPQHPVGTRELAFAVPLRRYGRRSGHANSWRSRVKLRHRPPSEKRMSGSLSRIQHDTHKPHRWTWRLVQ